jgi:hypothetical protein
MSYNISKDRDVREALHSKLQELNGYWSENYRYSDKLLEFRSGDMWEPNVQKEREEDKRPTVTVNFVNPMVNRVVNPLRMQPKGIRVHSENEEFTDLVSGVVREIERKSRAQESYETAFENAVTCGFGWVRVGLEYEDDQNLEQIITIDPIQNPLSVYIDPYSNKVDGSDARYGVLIDYMQRDDAKDKFGEEFGDAVTSGTVDGIDVYEYWTVPDDAVADVTYYEMVEETKTRYWYKGENSENITFSDEKPEEGIKIESQRDIIHKSCKVCRFVGQALVDETKVPIPFLLIVPCYGDRLHLNDRSRIKWTGLPHWVYDSQTMVNYYASNELELVSMAPKSPWLIEERQLENHTQTWATANTKNHAFLPYKQIVDKGVAVPLPQRTDNTAQTQGLIQSRQQAQADMSRATGVSEPMLGEKAASNTAAASQILATHQGELATAQYSQNFDQSLTQVGRVVMWLIPHAYDRPRRVATRDESGSRQVVTMNLSEIITPEILKDMDFEITSGPAYEGRRKESIQTMMEIGKLVPNSMSLMADILIENSDAPDKKKIAERFNKMLPSALQEGTNPLEAEQKLAQLEQENTALKTQLNKAQTELTDNQKDRNTDIAVKMIDSETKLAVESLKQAGMDDRSADQIIAEGEQQMKDIMANAVSEVRKLQAEAVKSMSSTNSK